MSDDALESYLTRWREGDPQRAAAWLFLRPDERIRFGALAALEAEWDKAIREAREVQVAATKLGWWREEMQRAAGGEARHPLALALFADARLRAIPERCWTDAVDAALLALTAAPPADLGAQLAAAQPLATALAELETRAWFGAGADRTRAAAVIALVQTTSALRNLDTVVANARTPLPMNLMARHGLALDDLANDTPARRAAIRDHAADLERGLAQAVTMPGQLGLLRAAGVQHDLHVLRLAARAEQPLAALQMPARGFRNLLKIWRAARIWRGTRIT